MKLHAAGQSLAVIARQFADSKATIHWVVAGARTAAQAPTPTTPAKAAAGRAGDDMADRATLEQKHGQRRLPAV